MRIIHRPVNRILSSLLGHAGEGGALRLGLHDAHGLGLPSYLNALSLPLVLLTCDNPRESDSGGGHEPIFKWSKKCIQLHNDHVTNQHGRW